LQACIGSLKTLRYLQAVTEIQKAKSPQSTEEGADIYVNFGYTSTTIFLYDVLTTQPIQVHNFPLGVEIFKRDIKASFPIDENKIDELFQRIGFSQQSSGQDLNTLLASPLNEFISEFKRFLISSKELIKGRIMHVYLFGEGSKILGIDAKLTALLGAPVALYSPYELFSKNQVSDYFKNDWQTLIPTIGGALR
jgi:Tfp pilus assembly PilM family ATPase